MEHYDTKLNKWTVINKTPNVNFKLDQDYSSVKGTTPDSTSIHLCAYSKGRIFAVFSELYTLPGNQDPRFHIFDTKLKSWMVSQTKIKRKAYYPVHAVIPANPDC